LLDDSGDYTKESLEVLEEVFARFDLDKDGALDGNELDQFAIACNGKAFDDDSKRDILDNFTGEENAPKISSICI
jgi:Ca2+-binding EF-hand superfamily protein